MRLIAVSTGGTPAVAQDFDAASNSFDLYYPAVTLNNSGDLFIAYSQSSSTMYPSAEGVDSLAATPMTFENSVTIASGRTSYSGVRWGDYSGAAQDPLDPTKVWLTAEYQASASNTGDWGTATAEIEVQPCSTAMVTSNPPSPQVIGTLVSFTASSTGCADPVYAYYLQNPSGVWELVRSFSSSPTLNWSTAGYAAGTYVIHVWADAASSNTSTYQAIGATSYQLNLPNACATASLSPPSTSQTAGSTIDFTASSTGCPSPQYQFFVQYPDSTSHLLQTWGGASFNWNTSGLKPGAYTVNVWANDIGHPTATFEALGSATVTLTGCLETTLAASQSSPQPIGTQVTFTASSSGCTPPVYEFWLQSPGGAVTLKQPFGPSVAWQWDTRGYAAGTYTITVWANQSGADLTAPEASGYSIFMLTVPAHCATAALSPSSPSQPAGTTVAFTASSTICPFPQYQFFVQYPNGRWYLKQGWGANAFNWDTTGLVPGTYTVHVWANQMSDSTATFEALGSATVTLTGCTSASISPPSVGQQAGTTVNLTASAVTCPNPQFEWFVQYPNGTWYSKQPWGGPSFGWDTTGLAPGIYTVHVWANQQGASIATYETYGAGTVSVSLCTSAGLGPPSPSAPAGSTVMMNATSGGCSNPHYAFYVQFPNGTWYLEQPFSSSAVFNWDTTGLAPGRYVVHAWVSAIGSGHDSVGSDTVTLTGCTTASVTAPSQAPAGTTVNLTGAGSAGCPSPQFEYWVQYPDMTWHLGRIWGSAPWSWDTSAYGGLKPGLYTIHAWANQSGASTATFEAIGSAIVNLTGCTGASVVPSTGTDPVGTSILFTVTPNCTGIAVYEFWLQYPDLSWHQETSFTTSNTWTWSNSGPVKGSYVLHVWVNNQGASTSRFETIGSANQTLN